MSRSDFGDLLVKEIPRLRAYAFSLSGTSSAADDLVQETLVKAWANSASFQEGTNLRAWLVTILRNTHFTQYHKARREVSDEDGVYSGQLAVDGGQLSTLELHQVQEAINQLPTEQREILSMICVAELSYEETCEVLALPMGTVKSRLNRARARLAETLGLDAKPRARQADASGSGRAPSFSTPDRGVG
jgi:RNA polymerase sigma-70 factor (ECF subfamily)